MDKPKQGISYSWQDCPKQVRGLVNVILTFYRKLLEENLIGFYLHGSLAMGCFNPPKSDIDFLAVVRCKLTLKEKKSIIGYLLSIDDGVSAAAPEMSIVTEASIKNLVFPTSFELHYSRSWRDRYLNGDIEWNVQKYDEDLTMHYLAVQRRGICLYGKKIEATFPEVPREMYLASTIYELDWISERLDSLPANYIVLNSCRALALLREDALMSKKEGGEWALANLPGKFSGIVHQALVEYSSDKEVGSSDREALRNFLEYARKGFN